MVTKARALLGYEDKKIGVYLNHSQIAKVDFGTTGPYLLIKQAIDRAILENNEQQGPLGRFDIPRSGDVPLPRSAYAVPLLGDGLNPKTGLIPELARLSGRNESPSNTEGDKDSLTATSLRSPSCRPNPVGEDSPINRAIFDGDIAKVRKLLKDAHLDKLDSQGYTPLMVAAATDQEQTVHYLIKREASLGISGPKGQTAFHLACRHAGVAVASIFLKHAELLDIRDDRGRTPLMSSIKNPEVIKLLGKNRADFNALTTNLDGCRSAIHLALRKLGPSDNQTRSLGLLIKYGANIEQQDGAGRTPLHLAAQRGESTTAKWLILNKANLEARTDDRYERTPLHIAVHCGHLETARVLLDAGSNKDAAMKRSSEKTSLHIATLETGDEKVKELLDSICGPGSLLWPGDATSLSIATWNGNIDIMKLLLEVGADVEGMCSNFSFRPLSIAVIKGNLAAVRTLLHYNATPEVKGTDTPLVLATQAGNIPIMKELLTGGVKADVASTNSEGYPCLFIAASLGHVDAVKLLLDYGADPEKMVAVDFPAYKGPGKAGEYFRHEVGEQSRTRIRETLGITWSTRLGRILGRGRGKGT